MQLERQQGKVKIKEFLAKKIGKIKHDIQADRFSPQLQTKH